MNISGHSIRQHIRNLAPLFGLIAAVWALRWIASALGAHRNVVQVFSVTFTTSVCILLAVLLIHLRRFGAYASVIAAAFLLVCWEQFLIISAIAVALFTSTGNVFTAPEYSGHMGTPLAHIVGHLTFGIGIRTIFGSAMGCVLFWVIRRLVPVNRESLSEAGKSARRGGSS